MPKLYAGEEHVNVAPIDVRLEQVGRWEAMKAGMEAKRREGSFCVLPVQCQPGEGIRQSDLVRLYRAPMEAED